MAEGKRGDNSCAILSVVAVLGAPLLFGIIIGSTGPSIDTMKNEVLDFEGRVLRLPDTSNLVVFNANEAALYTALVAVGAIVGSLVSGVMANAVGFRWTLISTIPLYMGSWCIMGFLSDVKMLYLSRALTGIAVGINSFVVPTYISDIAPTKLRGLLGACNQLCVTVGILLVYVVGMYCTASDGYIYDIDAEKTDPVAAAPPGSFCQWRHMALFNVIPTLIFALSAFFIPESPRWLVSQGLLSKAVEVMETLRGGLCAVPESEWKALGVVYRNSESGGIVKIPSKKSDEFSPIIVRSPLWEFRKQVMIGAMLQVFQQFSGINAVMFFCTTIMRKAHMEHAPRVSVWIMLEQVVVTFAACLLMDRAGRKSLLITGASVMAVACAILGIFFVLQGNTDGLLALTAVGKDALSVLIVGGMFLYIGGFSLGVGAIPWLIMGEIFPAEIRTTASSIATTVNWTCVFLVTICMKPLVALINYEGVMCVFGVSCVLLVVFTILFVPETKNISFDEIQKFFNKGYVKVKETDRTSRIESQSTTDDEVEDGIAEGAIRSRRSVPMPRRGEMKSAGSRRRGIEEQARLLEYSDSEDSLVGSRRDKRQYRPRPEAYLDQGRHRRQEGVVSDKDIINQLLEMSGENRGVPVSEEEISRMDGDVPFEVDTDLFEDWVRRDAFRDNVAKYPLRRLGKMVMPMA